MTLNEKNVYSLTLQRGRGLEFTHFIQGTVIMQIIVYHSMYKPDRLCWNILDMRRNIDNIPTWSIWYIHSRI